jgi:hypothetical protein
MDGLFRQRVVGMIGALLLCVGALVAPISAKAQQELVQSVGLLVDPTTKT